ncbi:MAG: PH domain-containing protein [archaeon]
MTDTIRTNNTRRVYLPHYLLFIALLAGCAYFTLEGRLTLTAFGAAMVLVFLGVASTEIHRLGQTYEVNPSAVVHSHGYISRHHRRIDLFAINDVTVSQTLFQRVFRFGDVHVRIANASHQTILKNIHHPKKFAHTIENNMHNARHKDHGEENTHSNTNLPQDQHPFKHPENIHSNTPKDDHFHSKNSKFRSRPWHRNRHNNQEEELEETDAEIFERLQEI